jgi:hypothetical protein
MKKRGDNEILLAVPGSEDSTKRWLRWGFASAVAFKIVCHECIEG